MALVSDIHCETLVGDLLAHPSPFMFFASVAFIADCSENGEGCAVAVPRRQEHLFLSLCFLPVWRLSPTVLKMGEGVL